MPVRIVHQGSGLELRPGTGLGKRKRTSDLAIALDWRSLGG
jgi:hypothetical protein